MQPETKARFPFNMIEKMMPMYPMIAFMGWMFVLIALLIGAFVLSPAQSAFFSDSKVVREMASAGSAFVNANITSHVVEAWLPQFKFFGLGLGLMAIVMALGTIAKKLQHMGMVITSHFPDGMAPSMPSPPKTVRVFQMSTLIGIMVLLTVLVIGIVLATGVVPEYWNNSIANQLNTASSGSLLLGQLGIVSSYTKWLNPLRIIGMSFLFSGITVALAVVIGTLRFQAALLVNFYNEAKD